MKSLKGLSDKDLLNRLHKLVAKKKPSHSKSSPTSPKSTGENSTCPEDSARFPTTALHTWATVSRRHGAGYELPE
jgi:hypothetical protein